MYPAKHFSQDDRQQQLALIKEYPLATILLPSSENKLNDVCQIPLLFDSSQQIFIGHVAIYNPLSAINEQEVSLVFNSENCYQPPSYSNNKALPSWLYARVEVTAEVSIVSSLNKKKQIMTLLTDHFEQHFNALEQDNWQITQLSEKNLHGMFQQLTFIEFKPITWRGNFKMSQNKPDDIRQLIKTNLIKTGQPGIAKLFGASSQRKPNG
ncbi:FMN-binding negative transcriptional regulator [Pseudoalteromonas sp. H105]|jgi:transcriptional regulator|uniref:FMN-binding negative transcriptional regulator n=1 Tax=Pseudoalteromonas sp. H105 TaxID=1348393 RepID=UPI0007323EC4|nr:FMN-binding negative transcriptional regulator [Pseudoalteromonas sp. H105]KTF15991.1 transcriptional regulator [Pseudoalteromonas sp. H105]